ncbi:MAG: DUF2461 domain-containing protein [Paludibacter sp.]|nr:DUF2461 domain-containing protein [Paludibacter sp.]MDD4199297.1 DUF2461 domain-containing protein [Paludibacter sp.]MDD4427052.1 DUF2461 domain-containing protein [Paludibacter sp.]
MKITNILSFLSDLNENNTREWFALNKDRYEQTKSDFEKISQLLIDKIACFDEEINHLSAKDCVFRIYRDTRFSQDKTPYKTHYGVFIAAGGGRKSVRGGYYLHFEPGKSFVAVGVWCPPPEILKALRQSVYNNIEELKEIIHHPEFKKYFQGFYEGEKLKTAPKGFPKDFPEIELLKLKHYMVEYPLPENLLSDENFVSILAEILQKAQPLNAFLNYTVDEVS